MTSRRKSRHLRKNANARRRKADDPAWLASGGTRWLTFRLLPILVPSLPVRKDVPPADVIHGKPA